MSGTPSSDQQHAATAPSPSSAPSSTPHILIAEDDARSRRLVAQIVAAAGIGVVEAEDGQEALDLLADDEASAHLIGMLVDIDMPRVDGKELVRRLREDARWRDLPVAMVTALANPHDEAASWELGCDYFLRKPVVLTELRGVIRAMLVQATR